MDEKLAVTDISKMLILQNAAPSQLGYALSFLLEPSPCFDFLACLIVEMGWAFCLFLSIFS